MQRNFVNNITKKNNIWQQHYLSNSCSHGSTFINNRQFSSVQHTATTQRHVKKRIPGFFRRDVSALLPRGP